MNVYRTILEKLKQEKLHMTLIDPASQPPEKSALIAKEADKAGSDFIMIGGSTEIDHEKMSDTIDRIKEATDLKVIIFPGSASMISDRADAIYFMSLMNSKKREYLMEHQVKAAPFLKSMGIETISMGYLVFDPGMTVGRVGDAELIGREDVETADSYALAAEMFGMKLLYLEAGSGSPTHVSEKVISGIKKFLNIPLIVGGGIRTVAAAESVVRAGADIVVTGTIAEKAKNVYSSLSPIISSIKGKNSSDKSSAQKNKI